MAWQQFLAIVLGAIVSGIIGIFTVLLTGRMRDRQWLKENVIRPLYNEIDRIHLSEGHEIRGDFRSVWSQVDPYTRLRVNEELRAELSNYSNAITQLQSVLKRYEDVKQETTVIFEEMVRRAMGNYLVDDGRSILLESHVGGSSSIEIGKWLGMFLEVLLSHKDEHILAEALIRKSESSRWGHEKFFRLWQSERPSIFADLAREFREAQMPHEYRHALAEMQRLRQQLVSQAESLAKQLVKEDRKRW